MQISINAQDVTDRVSYTSLRIENILTQQVDRCTFTIINSSTDVYKPRVGAEVIILDDSSNRIFGGVITRRSDVSPIHGSLNYSVECADYTRVLDQKLVAETYENMMVDDIIADIITNYAPAGFTFNQVVCSQTVAYIQFQYLAVSECIKRLADITGFDWYVDYDMDIYFQTPSANAAPITVTDGGGTHVMGSLVIRRDNSQLRTSIIVRGGEYLGTEFTSSAEADGKDVIFRLPYKYSDFKIRKNGVRQTVGIDYIDDPVDFDVLHNFGEKLVRWRSDNKPAAGATLSYAGKPHLPVITRYTDPVAVSAIFSAEGIGDGEYEYVINDKAINSQVGARERAAAEVRTYGETLSEGEFETESSGLQAGQRIRVQSTARNIDEFFIINKVTTVMKGPRSLKYKISLITTKTMDYITVMKKLLLADNKSIELTENETLDLITSAVETLTLTDAVFTADHNLQSQTMSLAETFTAESKNWPVQFVWGAQTPSGFKRVFIVNGSRLG